MIETVVGAIASPIFEQLLNVGGSVAKEIKGAKDDVSAINKRLEACRRYEQRYGDRPLALTLRLTLWSQLKILSLDLRL